MAGQEMGWAELFTSLVEESLLGVYIIQGDRFVYVNPRLAELFGYGVDEVVKERRVLDLVHPDDRATVTEKIALRLSGAVKSAHYRFRGLKKDGGVILVEVYGSSTVFRGEPAVIGTVLDVTEKARAEEERTSFINMLTHDIRGPLTVISGYSELLGATCTDRGAADLIAEMGKAVQRINALIEDILALSRYEAGGADLDISRFALDEVIRQAVRDNEGPATASGVEVMVEAPMPAPEVYGDKRQLARAIANLVDNAVNYNREGGSVTVRTGLMPEDPAFAFVEVTDSGRGIAPEDLPHVFDKYYRGRIAGKSKGTGLGLAIVRAVAEAHKGCVTVTSKEGEGSTFTVFLPAAISEVTPPQSPS